MGKGVHYKEKVVCLKFRKLFHECFSLIPKNYTWYSVLFVLNTHPPSLRAIFKIRFPQIFKMCLKIRIFKKRLQNPPPLLSSKKNIVVGVFKTNKTVPGIEIVTYVTVDSVSGCDFQRHKWAGKSAFLPLPSLIYDLLIFIFSQCTIFQLKHLKRCGINRFAELNRLTSCYFDILPKIAVKVTKIKVNNYF